MTFSLWKGNLETFPDPRPEGGMRGLMAKVALEYGLEASDLLSISRHRKIAWARQDFMWRARNVKWADGSQRYSFPQIASVLGGMDHTTIIHGVRAHAARLGRLAHA